MLTSAAIRSPSGFTLAIIGERASAVRDAVGLDVAVLDAVVFGAAALGAAVLGLGASCPTGFGATSDPAASASRLPPPDEPAFGFAATGDRFGEGVAGPPRNPTPVLVAVVILFVPPALAFGRVVDCFAFAGVAAVFPPGFAAAPERAGAFRPTAAFPPAGRLADDVRLGLARRFAFAIRPR